MVYEAKKRIMRAKRCESQAYKRGSEAYWNPESKARMSNVRTAMLDLRRRREENNRDAGMNPDTDELSKSMN